MFVKSYPYVGPARISEIARTQPRGVAIRDVVGLKEWLASSPTEQTPEGNWIATFVIGVDQVLRVAPRRSEHVACAAGHRVCSAGEMTLDKSVGVVEISNQSTGYCPEPDSWFIVEKVLDHIGVIHPGRFTTQVIFRRCRNCHQQNIVKDSWYYCQMCDSELPLHWNFDEC